MAKPVVLIGTEFSLDNYDLMISTAPIIGAVHKIGTAGNATTHTVSLTLPNFSSSPWTAMSVWDYVQEPLSAKCGTGYVPQCERISHFYKQWSDVEKEKPSSTTSCIRAAGVFSDGYLSTDIWDYKRKPISSRHEQQVLQSYNGNPNRTQHNQTRSIHIHTRTGNFMQDINLSFSGRWHPV